MATVDLGGTLSRGAGAASAKRAVIHRMAVDHHICPWGLKALDLLKRRGFAVDDRLLRTREETDAFKAAHGVKTTPQVFIEGVRIGGYDALRAHLGLAVRDPKALSYTPVIVVFATALLFALAASFAAFGDVLHLRTVEWFVGFATCLLAMLKLQNVSAFSTMFLGYDLLARRWVPYATIYPYAEMLAGLLMVAGALMWIAAPLSLFVGGVGAASVFKAVYLDKRELKCACVGGDSSVPLGFVSLLENVMMVAMGAWMLARAL